MQRYGFKTAIIQSSLCCLRGILFVAVVLAIGPAAKSGHAQETSPPMTATVETPEAQPSVAEQTFRQQLSERLPELARVATERLPHLAQGNPPRINFFKVGKCVVTRSQHGGFASVAPQGGLVGICLIHGDMNVPASNSIFAVTVGAWRLSDQPWPLRNSEATVESIVVIDAEEP